MINNKLSWINLNATGGSGGTGGVSDYNQLANRPIKTLTGTTQSPIKLWKLDTGLYILNGYVQHTNELASEAKGLFTSVVAGVMNGSYVVSAFIPFWEGQYEYLLDSLASADYNEHQVVMILTQDDVLTLTNENEYTPTKDYHPSTKKYVDDMIVNFREELNEMGVNEENIESLIMENRRRDIAIQALLSQNSDKMVTVEEDTHIIPMDYSIDNGMAIINKMEGSTLVNVANQKEEIGLSYGQNNVASYSNEIVTEQDTTVNPILEGNTVVNVANQRSKVIVTKEYDTVENSNHIAVPNTVDEKIRPVVEGNTLVNLIDGNHAKAIGVSSDTQAKYSYIRPPELGKQYTMIVYASGLEGETSFITVSLNSGTNSVHQIYNGLNVIVFDLNYNVTANNQFWIYYSGSQTIHVSNPMIEYVMMFEGDLTANPPSGYIEGLQSSFEDGYIPYSLINMNNLLYQKGINNLNLNTKTSVENRTDRCIFVADVLPATTYTILLGNGLSGDSSIVESNLSNNNTGVIATWLKGNRTITTSEDTVKLYIHLRVDSNNTDFTNENQLIGQLMLLEGDWTSNPPTYEDVVNYNGKYKVEYNVVGKNKFDESMAVQGYVFHVGGGYSGQLLKTEVGSANENKLWVSDYIRVRKNQIFTLPSGVNSSSLIGVGFFNSDKEYVNGLPLYEPPGTPFTFTSPIDGYMRATLFSDYPLQVEEGTQATEYEPYKSYTKTFYLNSPLLEGDTIEEIDGKATHVHRYDKVVFDGSENWTLDTVVSGTLCTRFALIPSNMSSGTNAVKSDRFMTRQGSHTDIEYVFTGSTSLSINILNNKLSTQNVKGFKQWLQENPTTVVYQLANPIYETISSSDIVIDSYANGHLDYNTIVPISSTKFVAYSKKMVYLNTSTSYTIQFNSDSIGTVDITLGGNKVEGKGVVQGLNQIEIATPSELVDNMLIIEGDNVGISELIVTPLNSANPTYGYFEGIQSCFEEQLVKNEDSPYYGKYRVEYRSDTDVKTVYLNSPLLMGDKIEEVDGKLYHWHKMSMIVFDGSEEWWTNKGAVTQNNVLGFMTSYKIYDMKGAYNDHLSFALCDKFVWSIEEAKHPINVDYECIAGQGSNPYEIAINISKSKLLTQDTEGFKQWLQNNPTTIIYELVNPYYEEILPSQILVRTSANGKLSFNSDIPLASIQLVPYEQELTYLYASTVYTVQFVANANCNVNVTLGGATLQNQAVTVGLNKIQITTPSTLVDNKLRLDVIGNCKISELVVTNSTEEFGYFEGMKSTFEDTVGEEGYNAEVIIYNAPIRFGKGGRL